MKLIPILCLMFALIGCATSDEVEPTVGVGETAVSPTTAAVTNAASAAEADPSKITPSPIENDNPYVAPQPGVPGSPLDKMTMLVVDDLAKQQDTALEKISVVSSTSVEWANSELGCPRQGMEYLMVITPGYRIVLAVDGQEYTYHTDEKRSFILCTEEK